VRAYVTPSEEIKAIFGKTSRIRKSEYGSSTADVEQAAHCAKCQRQPIANGMKLLEPHLLMLGDQA
jgi:hypothetical protein